MGTEISLDLGGVALESSKNHMGQHYGELFQEQDRRRLRSEEINYAYFEEHGLDPGEHEMAFSRSLRTVVPRLEMLGVGMHAVRAAYDVAAEQWYELQEMLAESDLDLGVTQPPKPLSFDECLAFICANPIPELDSRPYKDALSERCGRGRFEGNATIARLPINDEYGHLAYSERNYFISLMNFLTPHATLRLLAVCPANLELDVVWQYGPLVKNGWAASTDFTSGPSRRQTTLVVTEGSSDVHILTHALKLMRPFVADFFRFIDVSERHPFSGTGSLANFAEGLAKIDVHNQVVFVFDNDVEGVEAAARVRKLKLPTNMSVLVLPDLEAFQKFPSQGPNGVTVSDINGRAAAIECYLDLRLTNRPPALVQWTNLKRDPDVYQGALKHKGTYMDAFLAQTAQSILDSDYDTSKIEHVLDALIEECGHLARAASNA